MVISVQTCSTRARGGRNEVKQPALKRVVPRSLTQCRIIQRPRFSGLRSRRKYSGLTATNQKGGRLVNMYLKWLMRLEESECFGIIQKIYGLDNNWSKQRSYSFLQDVKFAVGGVF